MVIPAGGEIDTEFAKVVGTKSKALIKLNDKTVLRHSIEALRACSQIGRIVVVGSPEVCAHDDAKLADAVLPEAGSSPKNIAAGALHLSTLNLPPDRIVIVTADLPYLKAESIDRFLSMCDHFVDFNVPLVSKDDFDEAFPGAEATFVKLLDGEWTTGCVYLITTRGLKVALEHLEKVFIRRKSKLGMARMLGVKFVWDYFTKKLTVSDIEAKVTDLLNVRGKAVPGAPPDFAYDIDYIEDYKYVLSSLNIRQVGMDVPKP